MDKGDERKFALDVEAVEGVHTGYSNRVVALVEYADDVGMDSADDDGKSGIEVLSNAKMFGQLVDGVCVERMFRRSFVDFVVGRYGNKYGDWQGKKKEEREGRSTMRSFEKNHDDDAVSIQIHQLDIDLEDHTLSEVMMILCHPLFKL
ncbi:unnamed protein product [Anisakis simplex]|uniref:CACTA en-spm transposon protein n=1 Tax=Anisakis simplex TaxID=6269 RepID=A0A0M3K5Z2_ANISI|nr:unnamed protein product [Anisakis simplex]